MLIFHILSIFIRNFIQHFKYFQYTKRDTTDWLENDGISWIGPDEDHNGIFMWSHVFLHDDGHQKIAIILLDSKSESNDRINDNFMLSSLMSSVQIYNLWGNIQEYNLDPLKKFTESVRMSLDPKPLQLLQLLIPDWVSNDTYTYGTDGGIHMFDDYFKSIANQPETSTAFREHMSLCFSEVECFLMPHCDLDSMGNELKKNLKDIITSLLSPSKLRLKTVSGQQISAGEVITYFKAWVQTNPRTSEAKNLYIKKMKKACKNRSLSESDFNAKDESIRICCLQLVGKNLKTYKFSSKNLFNETIFSVVLKF